MGGYSLTGFGFISLLWDFLFTRLTVPKWCYIIFQAKEEKEKKEKELRKTTPHLWNLNEDSQLSGKIFHFIKPGKFLHELATI